MFGGEEKPDPSFWHPPSLDDSKWEFPFRPAVIESVKKGVVSNRGRECLTISVYPIMSRPEGLEQLSSTLRERFIPLGVNVRGADPRSPFVTPPWLRENMFVYNTCQTLTVSLDPTLISVSYGFSSYNP
jgi:hypothetical protein